MISPLQRENSGTQYKFCSDLHLRLNTSMELKIYVLNMSPILILLFLFNVFTCSEYYLHGNDYLKVFTKEIFYEELYRI